MSPLDVSAAIEDCLRRLADPARASPMQAYLLNQFVFLGLPAPARRAAVEDLLAHPAYDAKAFLATAEALWRLPEREFRYTAIDLLRRHQRLLRPKQLPAIKRLLLADPWWETVDGLAAVVGAIVRADRIKPGARCAMDDWIVDTSMWVRRAAMLHQLGWRLDTDQARLTAYALSLAGEEDFFIRKAIGWALRDYARSHPGFVRDFVARHRDRLSGLTVREACKRLGSAG